MWHRTTANSVALLLTVATSMAAPQFTPRATHIDHQYLGGWEHFVGGGVAAFDCNNDQLPELYFAGGTAPATLLRNATGERGADIDFEKMAAEEIELTRVIGAYPLNINNDAHTDLVILRVGENMLFEGQGDCRFARSDLLDGLEVDHWTTAFSAIWEANQELPTLAFGNYVDRKDPEGPFGTCEPNIVLRPEGNRYNEATELTPGYCALSILFSDWSGQGQQDLRVSNDRHYYLNDGQEQLWQFTAERPHLVTAGEGWQKHQIWGMGIASRDINFDGVPEVYLTSMGDQKLHSLAQNAEGPTFTDAAYEKGITAHRPYLGDEGRPSTGWHAQFGDVQNDGLDDIFVAKGNVDQMIGVAMRDPNNLLVQQPDGRFVEQGDVAGIASLDRSRGGALIDLNLDGKLDLVVNNRRAEAEIYQNTTADPGNWLAIKLEQLAPNRDAIGAWIKVRTPERTYSREITVGGGHAGGQLAPAHFGLGDQAKVEMQVIWPDQTKSDWQTLETNQAYQVARDGAALVISAY
ncbi:CRTAC1 family protein [Maritalea mediterranea]|uniref:CRTAC1 family protein n=1 Tax=Maritalea mediterranea TaxID=2909667 RepID=A0ABS9E8G5_9HYPH|nr:CRTAC1 family protein [Maritalea mediterranea]MCF4098484.1 CRTAC1 family protein [Maritalea mediterranea]